MKSVDEIRVLLPEHKDLVMSFSKKMLSQRLSDPMEQEMQSWTAPWRSEALDHYLNLGWSYGLFQGQELKGYLLAQPFLFYRGLTQTLWVEHLEASDPAQSLSLLDTAYRWARDKHFQCLLLEERADILERLDFWKSAKRLDSGWIEIRSAKF